MSVTVRADSATEFFVGSPSPDLIVAVFPEGCSCVVQATGELDLATRSQLFVATTAGNHPAMVIDLAGLTFIDCSGSGCLVDCQLVIEGGCRAVEIRGRTGQPARLFDMIARHK